MNRQRNSPGTGVQKELEQRLLELQSLFEMSRILNSSLQMHSILNNLLLTLMGRMMISRGFVMVRQDDDQFELIIVKGLSREFLHMRLLANDDLQRPLLTDDIPDREGELKSFVQNQRIALLLPIHNQDQLIGLIGLGEKIGNQSFTNSEFEYLASLSNIAATAMQNAWMYKKLQTVNRQLDRKIKELNTLFAIGKELNSTLDEEKIIAMLSDAVMGEMEIYRCLVLIKRDGVLQMVATRGTQIAPMDLAEPGNRALEERLSSQLHPLLVNGVAPDDLLQSLAAWGVDLAIPMRIQAEFRGVLLLGQKVNRQPFDADEIEFLFTLANRAMISLENARLFKEALEKQKIEDELLLAHDIQQRLLPTKSPEIPGVQIAGLNIPSRQVGGDYFDWIPLTGNRVACVVADVSGKGVGASLIMAIIQASIHSLIHIHRHPDEMISQINNLIHSRTSDDKFITLFYIEIDPGRKQATYVNAGHNPPILLHRNGTMHCLDQGGLILGILPGITYRAETISLQKGDLILMFTDGVTEIRNPRDEEFGEQGVRDFLVGNRDRPIQEIVDQLLKRVREFAESEILPDDLTVLGVRLV